MEGKKGKTESKILEGQECVSKVDCNKQKSKIMLILYPVDQPPHISLGTLISINGLIKGTSFCLDGYIFIWIFIHFYLYFYHSNNKKCNNYFIIQKR